MLQRNALVTVSVGGESLGTWITRTGGQTEADGQKTRLGGMSDEVALGGPASTENVVVSRIFDTYIQSKAKALRAGVGISSMSVTYNVLDNQKRVTYSETYSGILNRFTLSDADDNSSDRGFVELELLTDQGVG